MNIVKIANKYLKIKIDNILIAIIVTANTIFDNKNVDVRYETLKFILKNNLITDKKIINDALKFSVLDDIYPIAKLLLKYGKAEPNQDVEKGFTLIDYAGQNYKYKFIKLLFKYGGKGNYWCENKTECEQFINELYSANKSSRFSNKNINYKKSFNDIQLNHNNIIIY